MTYAVENLVKKNMTLEIYTDGASRGNPGHSAVAYLFVIEEENGKRIIYEDSEYIGENTNNVSEYTAIIKALKKAKEYTRWDVVVYSDSELVIKQINGDYRIRAKHLEKLCKEVYEENEFFTNINFRHVPRENNYVSKCDELCNKKLDETLGKKNKEGKI